MNWLKHLNSKIKFDEPLKNKTTFKIGGKAKFFCQPQNRADLRSLLTSAKKHKTPIFIAGAGSNLLISDKGLQAAVVKLSSPSFKKISFKDRRVKVGSGLMLGQLVKKAQDRALSGTEFLAGIPGTVGGALVMNTGAWGKNIGDLVEEVEVMDYNGKIRVLNKKQIKFAYRRSGLEKFIILVATLKLTKKDKSKIFQDLKKNLENRRNSQDNSYPNAGCIFKNPFGESAGRLIDLCGLKGRKIGGACISDRHANFILNRGNATAEDVLKLISLIRKEVKQKFDINLQPEIKIWR